MMQAQLDAELCDHLAAGRAIYDGDPSLAAGVVKESPDGRREELVFDARGQEQVLRPLPPLVRDPACMVA